MIKKVFGAALVLSIAACSTEEPVSVDVLNLEQTLAQITAFEQSAWGGCDRGRYNGVREEGDERLPFWVCEGVFENSYPYEFMIVTEPNESDVRYTQLEYRRGHNDSFYALLRYFLRLQGIESAQTRTELRSEVSSAIFANPRHSAYTPIARLPDGRLLELAHNHPESAFSTLRVVNP
ncbi:MULTISPECIES: hypothetical protein [Gammaproteobacteria]|uniref:hypothetical protein n=1 Tax=Gammaproteobacteria TaxID=1236 RepID=UPI000DD0401A|nr:MULTISPECIES: hypothetical protein [Gammaproteobacteria]RTE86273.1 hypothetical protein DQX04_06805 [Aliidiomarina sp. B3213]TCZ91624.1 hypothetical protein EYQ95_06815 [Lysobacter sp. N42]